LLSILAIGPGSKTKTEDGDIIKAYMVMAVRVTVDLNMDNTRNMRVCQGIKH